MANIIEIPVPNAVNFEWTHSNLNRGRKLGYDAASEVLKDYKPTTQKRTLAGRSWRPRLIEERLGFP